MKVKNRIVIMLFHPLFHKSRVNRELLRAVENMEGVTIRIMYDLYPDFHIDVDEEQGILLGNDIVVWQHPFFWYSSPSLLKEWIDIVLEHGFAYGREGKALAGKKVMTAVSTGGRKEAYREGGERGYSIKQLLAPFQQTVTLCRMEYLPPFVIHGTHLLDKEGIAFAANEYRTVIQALRDNRLDAAVTREFEYMNDMIDQKQ